MGLLPSSRMQMVALGCRLKKWETHAVGSSGFAATVSAPGTRGASALEGRTSASQQELRRVEMARDRGWADRSDAACGGG